MLADGTAVVAAGNTIPIGEDWDHRRSREFAEELAHDFVFRIERKSRRAQSPLPEKGVDRGAHEGVIGTLDRKPASMTPS